MKLFWIVCCSLVAAFFLAGCKSEDGILWAEDGSSDAGQDADLDDAGDDSGQDGGKDASEDAGGDLGQDSGTDAGADAGGDLGQDSGADAGADAGGEASYDAGVDAGADGLYDAGADESMDAGTGDSGGDQQEHVPYCIQVCDSPADCATEYPPWDADNYECTDGACEYLGCLSDDECRAVSGMESYVCAQDNLAGVQVCVKSCSTASDCAMGLAPWDDDNYRCQGGACLYEGCNSDQECQAVQGMESYVCASQPRGGVDQCVLGCFTVEDCDMGSAAYDQDNYSCDDGLCVYTGCNSDQECQESMSGILSECR